MPNSQTWLNLPHRNEPSKIPIRKPTGRGQITSSTPTAKHNTHTNMPNHDKLSKIPIRKKPERGQITSSAAVVNESQLPPVQFIRKNPDLFLPFEILSLIVSFIPVTSDSQGLLHALTLVSRLCYSAAIARLYRCPYVRPTHFDMFVRTINSGVNRNGLEDSTARPDLSKLVETLRLIGDPGGQATGEFFGFDWLWENPFHHEPHTASNDHHAAQSMSIGNPGAILKCSNLRHLDLHSFTSSLAITDLCRATDELQYLEIFHFPSDGVRPPYPLTEFAICPKHVRELHIDGGLSFYISVWDYLQWPKSLTHLSIDSCFRLYPNNFGLILKNLGPQLQYLHIGPSMLRLMYEGEWGEWREWGGRCVFDNVLEYLTCIRHLSLTRCQIRTLAPRWCPSYSPWPGFSPLVELEIDNYDSQWECEIPWHQILSDVMDLILPNLRKIQVYGRQQGVEEEGSEIVTLLNELLRRLAREDGGATGIDESGAGVWFIENYRCDEP